MSIQETKLQAIADAIKEKLGTTDTIQASQFADKIGEIQIGVTKPSWVQGTLPIAGSAICYGDNKFIVINDSNVAYSTDGITWTTNTLPSNRYWYSICYGNGKFVAVALDNDKAIYSIDGITWTETTLPSTGYWRSVCYGNGKFVALGDNEVVYSTDGITWNTGEIHINNSY